MRPQFEPPQLEDDPDTEIELPPEIRLWRHVLAAMMFDALAYQRGMTRPGGEAAYRDLATCGAMLRWCCGWLDLDPVLVSRQFMNSCTSTEVVGLVQARTYSRRKGARSKG